ncbi:hypothetical protein [Mesorhizobium sp. M1B.F.Ca.ET.045.04.1.1]|uniref:hypothetical protein n=1 Tax=Mesorhizobium sp. M1B.F.Ca.ET.045.04.1.1 TaxID=2493673 RepID=UPI000F761C4E|nr:hypothetical protein [Mesorhizobium sp. M1B.F.Ca.ET.045.04.1.1]AZO28598.1 hypothetical protein EJ071_15195 [Mesorhizobium sp. M1B.F.Ca.ET.045.04.1.1]
MSASDKWLKAPVCGNQQSRTEQFPFLNIFKRKEVKCWPLRKQCNRGMPGDAAVLLTPELNGEVSDMVASPL